MRTTTVLRLCGAMLAPSIALGVASPAAARDQCVAIMQVVGVPANVAAASDEGGDDTNGDGQIWMDMGGGRMIGYIDCSDMPGSQHGDTYEQNYGSGETHRTGNSQAGGQVGRKWFARSGSHSTTSGSSSTQTSNSTGGSDDIPPAGQSPIAKKKKPVAQTQR